jgi:hypothetical protein
MPPKKKRCQKQSAAATKKAVQALARASITLRNARFKLKGLPPPKPANKKK